MRYLLTGYDPRFQGGLERFVERTKSLLEGCGHEVVAVKDPPTEVSGYDLVLMNKLPPDVNGLRRLKEQCGSRLRFFAHDHEAYCLRRHYYDPLRRNCRRTYTPFPCRLCACVTRPTWIPRALTRDMAGFLRELRDVNCFAPSRYMRENLLASGLTRVEVLPPAFVTARAAPRTDFMPEGKLRLAFAGSLIAGKGVRLLIDAVRLMQRPHTLTVMGTGRDEDALRARADSSVVFAGSVPRVDAEFDRHDLCVFPSLWSEPFGLVGVEAMARGLGVVAFDVGGVSDWLENGVTGIFAPEPTPAALAATLDSLAEPARLFRLGQAAMEKARRDFSPQNFIRRLI